MKKIDILVEKLLDECQKEGIDMYCLYNEKGVFNGLYRYDATNGKVVNLFEGIHSAISNKGYGSVTRGNRTFKVIDNECTE
jgi:hypothetical protein